MKIIATDIANLTDARYFAAWGVDGLAYNIDPSSPNSLSSAQLKEIADWVEGPTTIIKLDGLEVPELLNEVKSNIEIQNVIVGPFIDTTNLHQFEKVYRICTLEDGWQDNDTLILSFSHEISNISELQKEKITTLTSVSILMKINTIFIYLAVHFSLKRIQRSLPGFQLMKW